MRRPVSVKYVFLFSFTVRGVISPLLANVYLHYVFDLWVQRWRKHRATGEVIVVRYADDSVLGFQYRADAERFLHEWRERLRKFGLELHPDKTRLIEFGRFAAASRKQRGAGKPETFDFLGFTHICGQSRKHGKFLVLRKTVRKRLLAKLKELKEELRRRWHQSVAELGRWLRSVLQGYFNYHAVPGNLASVNSFRQEVSKRWLRALRRRGQKHPMTCSNAGSRFPNLFIRILLCALTPNIYGRSRMQECCPCGSVRGALGDRRPYRDPFRFGDCPNGTRALESVPAETARGRKQKRVVIRIAYGDLKICP